MRRRAFLVACCCAPAAMEAATVQARPLPKDPILLPDGKQLLPRTYRGKVVLIFMFNTLCPHCQDTALWLNRIQKDLGPRGVQIVGVAFNEEAKTLVGDFIARFRPSFPVGWMEMQNGLRYAALPKEVQPFVPVFLFVDRTSTVRSAFTGQDQLFQKGPLESERMTRGILNNMLSQGTASK